MTSDRLIPTARLRASFDVLCARVGVAGIDAWKATRLAMQALRVLMAARRANMEVQLKRDMLGNLAWRWRVIGQLGGEAALLSWEVRRAKSKHRIEVRAANLKARRAREGFFGDPRDTLQMRAWREAQRLKGARLRAMRAKRLELSGARPMILRDKARCDFEGQFRLPPIERAPDLSKAAGRRDIGALIDAKMGGEASPAARCNVYRAAGSFWCDATRIIEVTPRELLGRAQRRASPVHVAVNKTGCPEDGLARAYSSSELGHNQRVKYPP